MDSKLNAIYFLVKFVKKYLLNIWFLVLYNQLKRCNNYENNKKIWERIII